MIIHKTFLLISSILGFLAVAFGAFGGHALKGRLSQELFDIFEVGVRYHFYHLIVLLLLAFTQHLLGRAGLIAGWSFAAGTVLFSGSLYILALSGVRSFGMITPFGGLLLLLGWASLALSLIKL